MAGWDTFCLGDSASDECIESCSHRIISSLRHLTVAQTELSVLIESSLLPSGKICIFAERAGAHILATPQFVDSQKRPGTRIPLQSSISQESILWRS
jgi:hypothetical protein